MPKPVVVIGAGLAGLCCARRLRREGIAVVILEASDAPGGKVRSRHIEGFTLDQGFQVLFPAYPMARKELDYGRLDLRPFDLGALVLHGGDLVPVEPTNPIGFASSTLLGIADKYRLVDWTLDCTGLTAAQIERLPDISAERAFRQRGFSSAFLGRFARPFFGGIFQDRSLAVSRRALAYAWKMLAEGGAAVPAGGMAQIAKQLAEGLDLRTHARAAELKGTRRVSGVALETGETIDAEAVIVACDAPEAQRLSGFAMPSEWLGQTCLHFAAACPPVDDGTLILRADPGLVNVVVPISQVAPEYAPRNGHLVSATLLGVDGRPDHVIAADVRQELEYWFPGRDVHCWKLLGIDRIAHAQLAQPAGFARHLPSITPGSDGLYLAGEITAGSSIQGAMQSGVDCAELVIQDLAGVAA